MGQERVKQMNLTDEQVEAWKRAFELAGVDLDALGECLLKIAKALTIAYMELEKAMEQVANIARAGLIEAASELEEFEDLERELKMLDRPTAWDRKKRGRDGARRSGKPPPASGSTRPAKKRGAHEKGQVRVGGSGAGRGRRVDNEG